jgi:outer membrane receptor for ferrienterochelin and colicins
MLVRDVSAALLSLLLVVAAADPARAQSVTLSGRVTDRTTGTPVVRARVQATSESGRVATATTDTTGAYRLSVDPGTHTVFVSRIGFRAERVASVEVAAGASRTLDIGLSDLPSTLEQVVVTATRGAEPEKILESPNSISVVQAERIEQRSSATITDHIKAEPGLAISTGGLAQANIVSRGFNNAFSTSMLMLQDYRFAGVPSLRVNVPFLFTGTTEDIERIEILQGPAAALYGPNSGNGVLHIITKSPFTSPGTTIALDGGERSLARGALRHSGIFGGEKFGYKISGEYFRASDFEYRDPNEPATYSATDQRVPASRRGQRVDRDFDLEKYTGEARLDFRPGENTELISTAGYSLMGSALEVTTTFGAAQVKNWSYLNLQERFRHKQFFAQVFYNKSDAGNDHALDDDGTFYLRTGIPVVDRSSILVGQVQQGLRLGPTRFVFGGEYIATRPKTEGTIHGRNDDDDDINEYGGYLQTTTALMPKLDLLLAARGDVNSRIEGAQFSPRAALVFKPTSTQNLRFTFNRAFNSPASFSFFLDQFSGQTPAPGMPVQIMGNPSKEGWIFNRSCNGGAAGNLCMRSPYLPGALAPASAPAAFPGFVLALPTIVQQLPVSAFGSAGEAGRQGILGLLNHPQLGPILRSLRPTDANIGTILRDLGTGRVAENISDYSALGANFSNTFEVGYKGILGDRVRIATDLWFQKRPADPTTQLINPGVMLNPQQLGAYLGGSIGQALVAGGVPAAQAQALAAQAAAALTPLMAAIPVGATAFTHQNFTQPYLVFSYRAAEGFVNVWGTDIAAEFVLGGNWALAATYSHINKNVFTDAPGATEEVPFAANVPKHRGSAALRYDDLSRGFSSELRGRYADAFPVNSGVFNSYNVGTPVRYAPVPVNALVDIGASWRLPVAGTPRWSVNVTNLLNNEVPTFVGVPEIGRLITTRIAYTF